MTLRFEIGLNAIGSYKRLAYTPWHAIAELVDNSTQSYFDHQKELDKLFRKNSDKLIVRIVYDKDQDGGFLRVFDNAMGMSYEELERALHVALPPTITTGRSKYGMGLKTAACWIGNCWKIKTKKLGETTEHQITINVKDIEAGVGEVPHEQIDGKNSEQHYTIIEISDHNRRFQGRTLGKIKDFLRSMYREDLRKGFLLLEWQGQQLAWNELPMLEATDGSAYRKTFQFDVDGKPVHGWVGILARGSRANAGFSIIHCGRVVHGWPDSWRPASLYGQIQGSNDLVNQRLVGEVHLDGFDVSHTKDNILWLGSQEEEVEEHLLKYCSDYRQVALEYRKREEDERGPSETEVDVALDELKRELSSPEMVDQIAVKVVPSEEIVAESVIRLTKVVSGRQETYRAEFQDLTVKGFIAGDMSPNDPYVVVDSTRPSEILVIINRIHPHWGQLKGSDGVLNYLRHCTYDAIAEWQARHKAARIDPNTIKLLKDILLRVPFEIEMHSAAEAPTEAEGS